MAKHWMVEIEPDSSQGNSYVIRLKLRDHKGEPLGDVLEEARSLETFLANVEHLQEELSNLARETVHEIESLEKKKARTEKRPPEEIWKEMEAMGSENEMFEFFNSFSELERQGVAEYVFTHVNMFKGKGPIFSEHYDAVTHLLE